MNWDDAAMDDMLRAAGRSDPSPGAMPADLAERVRRLRVHRRRTRRTVARVATLAVLLAGIVGTGHYARRPSGIAENRVANGSVSPERAPQRPAAEIARLRAEIALLSAEADARRRAVDELIARRQHREQMARLDEPLHPPERLEGARAEIEKAAFLLVDWAERRAPTWPDHAAADQYRRVVEHFPNTDAARVAQTRLEELTDNEGAL